MRFQTSKGEFEIADDVILAAAGRIYAARRRTHGGGRPPSQFPCRHCGVPQSGRAGLDKHERTCAARSDELLEVSDADLVPWSPDDAA